MLLWMLYVMTVSLCLTGGAIAAEQGARLRGSSTRWIWASAMTAALIIPAAVSSISVRAPAIPTLISPGMSQHTIALRALTSTRLTPATILGATAVRLNERPDTDASLQRAWLLTSIALLCGIFFSGLHLAYRKRQWTLETVAGDVVYVSKDVGPAVVGLLRPRIVVPQWMKEASPIVQLQVIAHERSHLEANDVRLLTGVLFLLVAMPWNLPLWWQLRRLRRAIEIDCDARVLRAGHDTQTYGETLIAVGQRHSTYIGAVAGMSESKSFLESRIRIMVRGPIRHWRALAAALGALSVAFVAVAADVAPPASADAATGDARSVVEVDSATLQRYVGFYQLEPRVVFEITLEGQQLFAQLTGQNRAEIYPSGNGKFFYRIVDAQISFQTDKDGTVTGLVLHQHGQDMPARRVDASTGQKVDDAFKARIQSGAPLPGSAAAARRLVDSIAAGHPIYDEMSPALADAVRTQLTQAQAMYAELGPVISIQFVGVGANGWDVYEIKHEHGNSHLRIMLDSNGIIIGSLQSRGI